MTVGDRDRKILWGRAGNVCSICRAMLVQEGDVGVSLAIIGDECHIVSPAPDGPRAGAAVDNLNGHENLILLCPNDHRRVDTLIDDYPVERLRDLKRSHEAWVQETLASRGDPAQVTLVRGVPGALRLLDSASDILAVITSVEESSFENETVESEEEVELVGSFQQLLFDWSEIWVDLEPAARIGATFEIDRALDSLRKEGWLVFGERTRGRLKGGVLGGETAWDTGYIRIVRRESDAIVRVDNPMGEGTGEAL